MKHANVTEHIHQYRPSYYEITLYCITLLSGEGLLLFKGLTMIFIRRSGLDAIPSHFYASLIASSPTLDQQLTDLLPEMFDQSV